MARPLDDWQPSTVILTSFGIQGLAAPRRGAGERLERSIGSLTPERHASSALDRMRCDHAGARVGGMIGDDVLLYGKVGYTNFRESNRFTPVGGGAALVVHPEFDGLRLGAGTEIAVGAKTFTKAEYRFSNYEASDSFDRHQGVIGFGLRF